MTVRRQATVQLERRLGRRGEDVLERLRDAAGPDGVAPEDVDRIAAELGLPRAHVNGAASFYDDLHGDHSQPHVRVCAGAACFAASGGAHLGACEGAAAEAGGSSSRVYCLGYCYGGPAALDGDSPRVGPDVAAQIEGVAERSDPEIPYVVAVDDPVVLARLAGPAEPWASWRSVLEQNAGERVLDEALASGLRGRGGAGFPAARKWQSAAAMAGPKYLIANGDEGDPGSYADRLLMERDPHGVLEGMALAARACGATQGYAYVRSEYPQASAAMRRAVEGARGDGHLGKDVHGSGVDFDIEVFEGAGSYVAGEETSLIHSIEGLRGSVLARPPFPTENGLFDRPTVVNNVETLSALPWIVEHGGSAYSALGTAESKGTKLVCLNERFQHPGVYEVEFGTSLRLICDDLGGGLRDGARMRCLQVGGPLGGFLAPEAIDVPLSFEGLAAQGVDLGHGGLVAFDERVSGADLLRHVWSFAADESCGACFPCRVGSRRGHELAERAGDGPLSPQDAELQEDLIETMGETSLCAFGRSIPAPVRTLMAIYAGELSPRGPE